jgi:hypothetical protein
VLHFPRYAYVKRRPLTGTARLTGDRIASLTRHTLRSHPRVTHVTVRPVNARRCP